MNHARKLPGALWLGVGLLAGLACGLVLIIASRQLSWNQFRASLRQNALQAGETAPDFELANLAGESIRLSELRGKPVLLNFWATWCGPCALEMPIFQHFQQQYPDLQIVAVNANEPAGAVEEFAKKWGLTFEILLDSEDHVNQMYNVFALPTTYFLDAAGQIKAIHTGSLNDKQLKEYLKQIGAME